MTAGAVGRWLSRVWGVLLLGGLGCPAAWAFAVGVSPPRFELAGAPGEVVRAVLDISQSSLEPLHLRVATADWRLDDAGAVLLTEELQPGSCRPWVALERTAVQLPVGKRMRFRFETRVPADAQRGECRYALVLEGLSLTTSAERPFDVHGRLAVIIYVRIGPARPELALERPQADSAQGVPRIHVRNAGDATGRLAGRLWLVLRDGQRVAMEPESAPILPGVTRLISLRPVDSTPPADPAPASAWSRLQGELRTEGSDGSPMVVDLAFGS